MSSERRSSRSLSESRVRELYCEKELSIREIADRTSSSHGQVSYLITKLGIDVRGPNGGLDDAPWRDEQTLRELYHGQGLNCEEVGDELGVAKSTINKWMQRNGIERRDIAKAHGILKKHPAEGPRDTTPDELTEEKWLREKHHQERMSTHEIAEELDCSRSCVSNWLDKHGIKTHKGVMSGGDHPNSGPHTETLSDADKLRQLYHEEGLTLDEIGNKIGCSGKAVWDWMNRHGISRRSMSEAVGSGEDHPRWKEGGDRIQYGPGWNDSKKQEVRNRDNKACRDPSCSITQRQHIEQYGEKLHVHHLEKARFIDDPEKRNAKENLITLCRDCHRRWEKIADAGLVPQLEVEA